MKKKSHAYREGMRWEPDVSFVPMKKAPCWKKVNGHIHEVGQVNRHGAGMVAL